MEGNMHIRCPKDVDMNLFTRLFSSLVTGDDLDDLIFNGEEWHKVNDNFRTFDMQHDSPTTVGIFILRRKYCTIKKLPMNRQLFADKNTLKLR